MKDFLLILFLFLSFSYCFSQPDGKSKKISPQKNTGITGLKVLQIITLGNEDRYYQSKFFVTGIINDSINLRNSDTLKKLYTKTDIVNGHFFDFKIKVRTVNNEFIIPVGSVNDFIKSDTLKFVLNYDTLSYKDKEEKEIITEAETKQLEADNQKLFKELFQELILEIEDKVSYYTKFIEGKKYNKIADFFYDEGFSRSYSTSGSVVKEIFLGTFIYDDISEQDKSFQIIVSLWHSYGYGKLFFSIDYKINFLGKTYYWLNGEWHSY